MVISLSLTPTLDIIFDCIPGVRHKAYLSLLLGTKAPRHIPFPSTSFYLLEGTPASKGAVGPPTFSETPGIGWLV